MWQLEIETSVDHKPPKPVSQITGYVMFFGYSLFCMVVGALIAGLIL